MRILLDHMIPHRLRHRIEGDVFTAKYMGWEGLQNGNLLEAADEAAFDVLVTNDKRMRYQQNLARYRVAILQLDAPSNDVNDMLPLVPRINEALKSIPSGGFMVVG